MRTTTHRHRWLGTAMALVALVLSFGTATVAAAPAAPAQAAAACPGIRIPIFNAKGWIVGWTCIPIYYETCPPCPDWTFELDSLVNPPPINEYLADGLVLLHQAAADPGEAEGLRAQAQEAFLAAASRLGDTEVQLGEVGIVNWERNVIEPVPEPWLVAGGTDVVDGLGLMQRALAEPDPTPWLAAGMAQFEEARLELVEQVPIGR